MGFDPISAALDIGGKLIDRLWPDPAQAAKAKMDLFQLQQTGELAKLTADTELAKAQLGVDQVEASNPRLFIAGWRPAVGWVCVAGLTYQVVLAPLARLGALLLGYSIVLPEVDPELNYILTGMLGFTHVSRSVEKFLGVDTK